MFRTFAVVALLGATAGEARADTDARARAQQLFDAGLADIEAGRFAEACPKFRASQEADPKTTTLLNLASCYERNGQTASAWGAFREAETLARRTTKPELERLAHEKAEALAPKLARLVIQVAKASAAAGLAVARDKVLVTSGEWNVAIPVDPGPHEIVAKAPGCVAWHATVDVTAGTVSVDVPELKPLPAAAAVPPTSPAQETWSGTRKAAFSVGVTGLALVATGGVLALVANANYSEARDGCSSVHACPHDLVVQSNRAYTLADVATVTMIGGAVLAAAGGTFFFVAPSLSAARGAAVGARWRF